MGDLVKGGRFWAMEGGADEDMDMAIVVMEEDGEISFRAGMLAEDALRDELAISVTMDESSLDGLFGGHRGSPSAPVVKGGVAAVTATLPEHNRGGMCL